MTGACMTLFSDPEAVVYRLYGTEGLLYVGCTTQLAVRLYHHSRGTAWWSAVRTVEVDAAIDREVARRSERMQIHWLAPLHNKVWNFKRGWRYGSHGITQEPLPA